MPRVVAWEPGRATCEAYKSKFDDVLVRVRNVRCDVLSSRCSGLWLLLPPKCTFTMVFFSCKHCMHDGCVDISYVGTLCMVYSWHSFNYN